MTTDVSVHMYVYLWEKIEKEERKKKRKEVERGEKMGGGERERGNENIQLNFLYK